MLSFVGRIDGGIPFLMRKLLTSALMVCDSMLKLTSVPSRSKITALIGIVCCFRCFVVEKRLVQVHLTNTLRYECFFVKLA